MLKGVGFSLFASVLFGYIYYFSTLLLPLSGEDIFGYRVIFTVPFVVAAVFIFRQKHMLISHLKRIKRQPWLFLVFCFNGAMMGFQMWLFLWAPNNGSALSVSLGYLLLPLVLVLCGRIFFNEHISKLKFIAIIFAAIGVTSNIALKGGLSWESLAVCGYALYFIIRKQLKMTDIAAFALEMLTTLPICIYFASQVDIPSVQLANEHIVGLLFLLGLLSGVAFNSYIAASNILPINLLGLLGYVEPIMMLIVALIIGEKIDAETYPLFVCLMIAMGFVLLDGVLKIKNNRT
ncbi:EamA family transporter RarD [Caviibacterium pharyngocola]|uniref:EamA family transporter RarD n=1 Tax=Caviibacterium pharyngocola TaxID=28159 RepID=A0A2M8RUE6_9PAST|nr:EamA family transporter RarD [Caviibacterium pharyngocola]PJG82501.1 EamA family transporter RarD [Caviibacterium pharyngocola]